MTSLKTNAENLDELDIAILELRELSMPGLENRGNVHYGHRGKCHAQLADLDLAISRLAMFDYYNIPGFPVPNYSEEWQPTLWCKIRGHRYDKRLDHSTHSLWPFQGKLEPRIARACINIAVGTKKEAHIVDPFCGSGTILLEANLMGFTSAGADVDPFAVWLTDTKLMTYVRTFTERVDQLWSQSDEAPLLELQRDRCKPTNTPSIITEQDALSFLATAKEVDAIVTSPPYYDAIDYNARHALLRQRLGLSPPQQLTLGIGMLIADYEKQVEQIATRMAEALVSGGRVVIIAAPYHGVDTPALYETALRDAGMGPIAQLTRRYRSPVLDIQADEILVMEKP